MADRREMHRPIDAEPDRAALAPTLRLHISTSSHKTNRLFVCVSLYRKAGKPHGKKSGSDRAHPHPDHFGGPDPVRQAWLWRGLDAADRGRDLDAALDKVHAARPATSLMVEFDLEAQPQGGAQRNQAQIEHFCSQLTRRSSVGQRIGVCT